MLWHWYSKAPIKPVATKHPKKLSIQLRECFDGTRTVRKEESETRIEGWVEGYLQIPEVKVPGFLDADSSWIKRITTAREYVPY